MSLVIPQEAITDSLDTFVNRIAPEDIILRLYANDATPSTASVAADFTEATGSGYAAIPLVPANWSAVVPGDELTPSTTSYPATTFTFTDAHAGIYGYYATRATSGRLAFAKRFTNAPLAIPGAGSTIEVEITLGATEING
jgi:hypothetical protein